VTKQLGSRSACSAAQCRGKPLVPKGTWTLDRLAAWYEVFGIDSIYDYDLVWEKRRGGIAPTFHSAGSNQALRNSPN
jgi:hypothetical protein